MDRAPLADVERTALRQRLGGPRAAVYSSKRRDRHREGASDGRLFVQHLKSKASRANTALIHEQLRQVTPYHAMCI